MPTSLEDCDANDVTQYTTSREVSPVYSISLLVVVPVRLLVLESVRLSDLIGAVLQGWGFILISRVCCGGRCYLCVDAVLLTILNITHSSGIFLQCTLFSYCDYFHIACMSASVGGCLTSPDLPDIVWVFLK